MFLFLIVFGYFGSSYYFLVGQEGGVGSGFDAYLAFFLAAASFATYLFRSAGTGFLSSGFLASFYWGAAFYCYGYWVCLVAGLAAGCAFYVEAGACGVFGAAGLSPGAFIIAIECLKEYLLCLPATTPRTAVVNKLNFIKYYKTILTNYKYKFYP